MINWGILGCGNIAHKFAESLKLVPEAKLIAVASQTPDKAKNFAAKYNVDIYYNNYNELATNSDIDVIYIATTHDMHCNNMILCLSNKKNVLCEKVFALNANEAKQVINLAKINKVFLMEAMWTRFLPIIVKLREIIENGEIGNVFQVKADLGYPIYHKNIDRVINPKLGGGALYDLGIYPISFAQMIFKELPKEINSNITYSNTRVDFHSSYYLKYSNGKTALLSSSFLTDLKNEAVVYGDKGIITIPNFHYGWKLEIMKFSYEKLKENPDTNEYSSKEVIEMKYEPFGYQYEIMEVNNCIKNNQKESKIMPLSDTLEIMQIIDKIKQIWD